MASHGITPEVKFHTERHRAGIMGSNLCATRNPNKKPNTVLRRGEAAWRPPNNATSGLSEAKKWAGRTPAVRQRILDGSTLDVDRSGDVGSPLNSHTGQFLLSEHETRERGWGEVHWSSYGELLGGLEKCLNETFRDLYGVPSPDGNWAQLNRHDRALWDGEKEGLLAEISICELEKVAQFSYPVYAFGYNWLESNEKSAVQLRQRIEAIIAFWTKSRRQCRSVILVTHSMGGLVARACAKMIPDQIVGIIHGAMPALGAPVCYRRIAYGTESSSPDKNWMENVAAGKFSDIAGRTPADTTAVMATAPGALELLPNHFYPERWLLASVQSTSNSKPIDYLRLPVGNPYELYRNMDLWYRVINPALADPANLYGDQVTAKIGSAIDQAEKFHRQILGSYYHPKSFAFYGDDVNQQTVGSCHWYVIGSKNRVTPDALDRAKLVSSGEAGTRNVMMPDGTNMNFALTTHYVTGDGTVPHQSGLGPLGNVQRVFRVQGFDHQGSFNNQSMVLLTQHLIAKMVQDL
jgi:pimeloyl-ACP methyl ester carboxylesterase